jgi:hypothetical protein
MIWSVWERVGSRSAASCRQLGFRDWGMPCLGRPQHRLALWRKTALKNIDIDRCVVEQRLFPQGRDSSLASRWDQARSVRPLLPQAPVDDQALPTGTHLVYRPALERYRCNVPQWIRSRPQMQVRV